MRGNPAAVLALAVACRGTQTSDNTGSGSGSAVRPVAVEPAKPRGATTCTRLPFAETSPVPEASGAAWLAIDGATALVVIGDSGNKGAYAILDPETGATREEGTLPLGAGTFDDLEGLAIHAGRLVAISSPGWIRTYERVAGGFALVGEPYALGPVDLPDGKLRDGATGMVCNENKVNCGRNYEGLCLAAKPSGPCLGFAASKADGHLYCVVARAGKLALDPKYSIEVTRPGVLADCAISDDGILLAGSNIFELGRVYRIDHWNDPPRATLEEIDGVAIGNAETIAIRGEVVYRTSDDNGAPSLLAKFRCVTPR